MWFRQIFAKCFKNAYKFIIMCHLPPGFINWKFLIPLGCILTRYTPGYTMISVEIDHFAARTSLFRFWVGRTQKSNNKKHKQPLLWIWQLLSQRDPCTRTKKKNTRFLQRGVLQICPTGTRGRLRMVISFWKGQTETCHTQVKNASVLGL